MKRKNEKVPEFDDIIFENRNKTYGAYDLRKRYKSAASLSILSGVIFCAILMTAISFTTEDGTASTGPKPVIIEIFDPIIPNQVTPPELKPPAEIIKAIKNLQPVVITDTSQSTSYIPTTEEITATIKDGRITEVEPISGSIYPEIPKEPEPFIFVEEMPEFPGGNNALMKYIGENISYPSDAHNNNIEGRVILKFVVNTDGSVDRIEVLRSIDPSLDYEAVRVIKTLPRFKPGKQGGVAVPVWFSLPVVFKIVYN
jgi:periplasmic protein TonB